MVLRVSLYQQLVEFCVLAHFVFFLVASSVKHYRNRGKPLQQFLQPQWKQGSA